MPNSAQEQAQRRAMLRELLLHGPANTQKTLVAALGTQGVHATQSSVSRDLKELGAIKTSNGYELPSDDDFSDEMAAVAEFLREITPAGPNLTVIKTAVGAAQRVAVFLDRTGWPEIVGTLSGDDSIFVATRNAGEQRRLVAKLRTQLDQ